MALSLLSLVLLWAAALSCWARPTSVELELIKAHRLQWPGNFQPSGLTWCRDRLLTISDRHDLEVLAIELPAGAPARVARYLSLERIPEPPPQAGLVDLIRQMILTVFHKQYDWEGITCDRDDNLYLASESYSALLKLPVDGEPEWITLAPHPIMQARGMLTRANAGIEGVQWLTNDELMIAAEMSPTGLIRCSLEGSLCKPTLVGVLSDQNLDENLRTWDISGLSTADEQLYVLERYYSQVCVRNWANFRIERCASFKAIEKASSYHHTGADWGQAEGLLVIGERLWVIIDNNGRSLASEPDSTDTWLFELKRPPNF